MTTETKDLLTKMQQRKELLLTAGIIAVLLIVLVSVFLFAQSAAQTKPVEETPVEEATYAALPYQPFANVHISAKAAIVQNINTGVILFEKNSYETLPLASLTKVVTALTATEILNEYHKEVVQINWNDLQQEGDDSLIAGEHFTTRDLLDFVLVTSSNDGARAIASAAGAFLIGDETIQTPEGAFIARMNTVAQKVGMTETRFFNESGLDTDEANREAGAIGSARDIATLFDYVLNNTPALLEATRADAITVKSKEGHEHHLQNTNEIVGRLPNILGSKTGFTATAGGNLAVVIDPSLNDPIVIVVLGSSKEGRFKDVERLTTATLEQLAISN
jgi:serine-type D-Ala-D-Ala carboxypeptidase (penicillin-binding protein 5/6)